MSAVLRLYSEHRDCFDSTTLPQFIDMMAYFQLYFLETSPAVWNYGRYKEYAAYYCDKNKIMNMDNDAYTTTWVGFLNDFTNPEQVLQQAQLLDSGIQVKQVTCAKQLLDVSTNQESLR